MGFTNVAIARMCQDRKSADAFFAASGQACPGTAGPRYRLAGGVIAPEARLVSLSRAVPDNPYSGGSAAIDPASPAFRAAVQQEAARMLRERDAGINAEPSAAYRANAIPAQPRP